MSRRPIATTDRLHLAALIRDRWPTPPLRYYRGQFYAYSDGGYAVVPDDEIERFIWLQLDAIYNGLAEYYEKPALSGALTGDVQTALQVLCVVASSTILPAIVEPTWLRAVSDTDDDEEIEAHQIGSEAGEMMVFRNGVLNIRILLKRGYAPLFAANPAVMTMHAFPFHYNRDAGCSLWLQTVHRIFDDDQERIDLLQEIFGCCLRPTIPPGQDDEEEDRQILQHFFQFEGPAKTGKSTVVNLLRDLLGTDNVSHVPLNLFAKDYELGPSIGKLVNISSDPTAINASVTALVKQFTGGDVLHINRKYLDPVSAAATAKLIITCNEAPAFQDHSQGIWRRLIRVPFTRVVDGDNSRIGKDLKRELPGIFNWAVDGLRRLEAQKRFTRSLLVDAANQEAQNEQDPITEWLSDNVVSDPAGVDVSVRDLYEKFSTAMVNDGEPHPITKHQFGKVVRKRFPGTRTWKRRVRGSLLSPRVVWEGIAMKD